MMKYLIISMILILTRCSNYIEEVESLFLNPDDAEVIVNKNLVKQINFLKLSSSQDSFIGSINKLMIKGDKIFILDGEQAVALFVYNLKGELLYKIADYGRGPGELQGPRDFDVDLNKNELLIFDLPGIKICYYSLDDGRFIREEQLDFIPSRFAISNDKFIFFNNNSVDGKSNNNIYITDNNYSVSEEYLPINKNMRGFFYNTVRNFTYFNSGIYFTQPFNNIIYKYSDDAFSEYLQIDFGNKNLPSKFYDSFESNRDRLEARENSAFNVTSFYETDNFQFFNYSTLDNTFYYLKSKISNKTIHTNYDQLVNYFGIGTFTRWPIEIYNDELIWYQQPTALFKYLQHIKENSNADEWRKFENENMQLISFAETLSENDNPYLIFTELDF